MKTNPLPLLLFWFVASPQSREPISVCELLAHGAEKRGQTVSVKGSLHTGPEELALYGVDCTPALETDGYKWPKAVWLTSPGGIPEEPVDFAVDKQAMEEFSRDVAKFRAANPKATSIPVVVIGKFEFPRKFVGGIGVNGKWVGNGYGHLNSYPGQIVLKLIRLDRPEGR